MTQTFEQQPDPQPGKEDVLPLILADLEKIKEGANSSSNPSPELLDLMAEEFKQRAAQGLAHYGTPLQTHNGRDAWRDAMDEKLDDLAYLRQAITEGDLPPDHPICEVYWHSFALATYLRLQIMARDETPTGCIPLPEGGADE